MTQEEAMAKAKELSIKDAANYFHVVQYGDKFYVTRYWEEHSLCYFEKGLKHEHTKIKQ